MEMQFDLMYAFAPASPNSLMSEAEAPNVDGAIHQVDSARSIGPALLLWQEQFCSFYSFHSLAYSRFRLIAARASASLPIQYTSFVDFTLLCCSETIPEAVTH